jgi:hypothetical protein
MSKARIIPIAKGRGRRKLRPVDDDSGVRRQEHLLFTLVDPRARWESIDYFVAPHQDGGWELRSRRGGRVDVESTRRRTLEGALDFAARIEASNVHEGWRRLTDAACSRCVDGWLCEVHIDQPMNHQLKSKECGGAGVPCSNPRCPERWVGMMPTLPAK